MEFHGNFFKSHMECHGTWLIWYSKITSSQILFLVFDWWLCVIWPKSHRNATYCIHFNIIIHILSSPTPQFQGNWIWHLNKHYYWYMFATKIPVHQPIYIWCQSEGPCRWQIIIKFIDDFVLNNFVSITDVLRLVEVIYLVLILKIATDGGHSKYDKKVY